MSVATSVDAADARRVQEAVEYYDALLANGQANRTSQLLSAHGEDHGHPFPPTPQVLRPWIVAESTYDAVRRSACGIATALRIAVTRLAEDAALRRAIAFPDYLEPLLDVDRAATPAATARIDGFLDATGAFKIIEYNVDPALHGAFETHCAFARTPIARAFADRYPFQSVDLLDAAFAAIVRDHRAAGGAGTPALAVVGLPGGIGEAPDWRWLPYLAARGCVVAAGRADEFDYRGGRLRLRGVPIDRIVLTNWRGLLTMPREWQRVLDAVRERAAGIVNGLAYGLLAARKNTLEILSDPAYRDWFPADVARLLDASVPWTRVLRRRRASIDGRDVDLLDYVSRHQDRFVLKPAASGRGVGVALGWTVSAAEWNRLLGRPGGTYVVQERVTPAAAVYPVGEDSGVTWMELITDCCPYVWNGTIASGCLARTSRAGCLNNVAAGGIRTATWVIGGERGSRGTS